MQTYSISGVRQERTGWRCQAISERHRHWGYNCPAVDLDFVVAEYNHGKPVALIEYKEKSARAPALSHPTYRTLCALADGYGDKAGGLPFMIVFYCPEDWWFRVIPVNQAAKDYLQGVGKEQNKLFCDTPITEQWFVYLLYRLRAKVLTQADCDAIEKLNKTLGDMEQAAA
jgi:hypothetical protein